MPETVVLCTTLGAGHLAPITELAKLLLLRHGFAATVVYIEPPLAGIPAVSSFISAVSATHPSITFHTIPASSVAYSPPPLDSSSSFAVKIFAFLKAANQNLLTFIRSISGDGAAVRAIVLDFFCANAVDVAAELGVPSYILFAGSVSFLANFLYLHLLRCELGSSGGSVSIPGLPPIPVSHLPSDPAGDPASFEASVEISTRFLDADGILVNSSADLEPAALMAVSGGLCVDPGRRMNPVYCIGPMIAADYPKRAPGSQRRHECLEWLDSQPEKSVVFLCFGSYGSHSGEQLTEIAMGLEMSGQRFLWVVLKPPAAVSMLPEGFVERIAGRGMVVASWVPQVEVLRHGSTGGFVTHCGWNSVIEAVVAGVPMIGWPMYAEQRLNVVVMAEELRLAVPMKGYDEGVVTASEVEEKVRWLMESEGGEELRQRASAAMSVAAAAMEEGGSSCEALAKVVSKWKVGME